MSLNDEEIKKIANLARIGIDDLEIESYKGDLSAVLDFFKKLEELDTNKVEPINHITGTQNRMREDKQRDFGKNGKEKLINNAPEVKDGQIKVKSVF